LHSVFCSAFSFFVAFVADHRGENENAFFATPDEAAKRVPSAKSSNVAWRLASASQSA
jgi:hypothetical protein